MLEIPFPFFEEFEEGKATNGRETILVETCTAATFGAGKECQARSSDAIVGPSGGGGLPSEHAQQIMALLDGRTMHPCVRLSALMLIGDYKTAQTPLNVQLFCSL